MEIEGLGEEGICQGAVIRCDFAASFLTTTVNCALKSWFHLPWGFFFYIMDLIQNLTAGDVMSVYIILGIGAFFALFGAVNYYIGVRVFNVFGRMAPIISPRIYWIVFWIVALSYIVAMLARRFMPRVLENTFVLIGSYWMGAMLYFMISLVLFDIVFLITRWTGLVSSEQGSRQNFYFITGTLSLLIVLVVLIYGTWNARHPHVTGYDIAINKSAGELKNLNVVMVSDLHLGDIIDNGRLKSMVQSINELLPDIVLLGGDIIDEDAAPFVRQNMAETFKGLKAKYGVYGVLGNHEYSRGQVEEIVKNLENSGIKVLRDDYIKINEGVYIAGRDDSSKQRFSGEKRKPLEVILADVDKSCPVILLDHKPAGLDQASKNGVDIQLSGHTHGGGQIFPDMIFSNRMFEIAYGYLLKGDTHVVVSSGYGTWGPPFRIGNKAEIVQLNIRFK